MSLWQERKDGKWRELDRQSRFLDDSPGCDDRPGLICRDPFAQGIDIPDEKRHVQAALLPNGDLESPQVEARSQQHSRRQRSGCPPGEDPQVIDGYCLP